MTLIESLTSPSACCCSFERVRFILYIFTQVFKEQNLDEIKGKIKEICKTDKYLSNDNNITYDVPSDLRNFLLHLCYPEDYSPIATDADKVRIVNAFAEGIEEITESDAPSKPGFGAHATTAMFVGLCAAYIGAYIGQAMPGGGSNFMPIFVAIVAAACMAVFEFLVQKKKMLVLENFSLAASMLIAMAAAVVVNLGL